MAKRPAPAKPTTSTTPKTSSDVKSTESLVRTNDSQPKPK